MMLTINKLRALVDSVIEEAKKKPKKKKEKQEEMNVSPGEYQYAEALDFSEPLGGYNLYKSQGAVNWGPMTGPGPAIDDSIRMPPVRVPLGEGAAPDSEWSHLVEAIDPQNIWETAARQLDEKHLGFKKLKNQIKRKEGYSDERAKSIAAAIGIKKFGKAGMARKAAAGKKKK